MHTFYINQLNYCVAGKLRQYNNSLPGHTLGTLLITLTDPDPGVSEQVFKPRRDPPPLE